MKLRRLSRISAAAVATVVLTGGGCAANLTFDSPSPLGSGVEGKSWQVPYFVDTPLYIPEALNVSPSFALDMDFAAATSGNNIQLVGSWWDASTALPSPTYRGYGRLYQDGIGWSGLGPNFGQIASDIANSFSSVTVAASTNGLYMSSFFDGLSGLPFNSNSPLFDGASAYYSGNGWQLALNNNGSLPLRAPTFLRPCPHSRHQCRQHVRLLGARLRYFTRI